MAIWFVFVTLIIGSLAHSHGRRSDGHQDDVEIVVGEVIPDDADRIWDEGRILAAKTGQRVQKGIVRR